MAEKKRSDKWKKIRVCIILTNTGQHFVSSGDWSFTDNELLERAFEWAEPANITRSFIFEMVLPYAAQVMDLGKFDFPNGEFNGSVKSIKIPSEVQLG